MPTTYAGAEWTSYFGMLLAPGRKGGGGDERAKPVAAIYDPELTLGLPVPETVGTAMNALAHCAEAYYAAGHTERGDRHADTGAAAINYALPLVAERPDWLYARTRLLEGAFRAALALEEAGLALGHAMAQALGGRYGLPQGAMNALCLPAALRFNSPPCRRPSPASGGRFAPTIRPRASSSSHGSAASSGSATSASRRRSSARSRRRSCAAMGRRRIRGRRHRVTSRSCCARSGERGQSPSASVPYVNRSPSSRR